MVYATFPYFTTQLSVPNIYLFKCGVKSLLPQCCTRKSILFGKRGCKFSWHILEAFQQRIYSAPLEMLCKEVLSLPEGALKPALICFVVQWNRWIVLNQSADA